MARRKIGVIGGGFVGSTTAQRLAERELGDVVLIDIIEGMPQGKALDLAQSGPVEGYDCTLAGANDYSALAGADIVVITAGIPRKPGMDRADLLRTNGEIMRSVIDGTKRHAPEAILVVISNPLDIMCWAAHRLSGLPRERVVGMAGVLDTARFRTFIAQELNVSVKDVQAMVLGGHGDSMVPLPEYASVSGIPLQQLIPKERLQALIDRTRHGGAEIVNLLKQGSAFYAPSASAVAMVESILKDQRRLLPCCCLLDGEYGIRGTWVGVPCVLGANGVEKLIVLDLAKDELAALRASADGVAKGQKQLAELMKL
ncbi:MAG: malate dehydrogenase [Planctomycetes bacterium]|nr:malate dehydrogenase [Planctomycetota bacterium]